MTPQQFAFFKGEGASRDGYGKGLKIIAQQDKDVFALDADLALSTKSIALKEVDPSRHFYVGICEQNMVAVAAGLALEGKKAFASTFSVFLLRAYEPIRQCICYANLPVKLVGSHSGIHTGEDGPTAQCTEDIAAFRALPRMNVIVPADAVEAEKATIFMWKFNEPCYMRICRNKTPTIFDNNYDFKFGKGVLLREGKDLTIIACGVPVSESLIAAENLAKEGINCSVINMSTVKPIDRDLIAKVAKQTGKILTVEDHQINGGLGSAVAEVLSESGISCKLKRVGLDNRFAESGKPKELYAKYGLDSVAIAKAVKSLLSK